MDLGDIPSFADWVKKNIPLAIALAVVGILCYGVFSFTGGYATKFGEAYVGSYSKFKKTVASYTVIDAMLNDFLTQFNASRISIARFHNSVHDVANNSLFYVSVETVASSPGVSAIFDEVNNNLPATVFSQILPDMVALKSVFILTKDLKPGTLKDLTEKRGTKAGLFVPIDDLSGQVIGMIHISWLSEHDVPAGPDLDKLVKALQQAASRIGGYYSAINR